MQYEWRTRTIVLRSGEWERGLRRPRRRWRSLQW